VGTQPTITDYLPRKTWPKTKEAMNDLHKIIHEPQKGINASVQLKKENIAEIKSFVGAKFEDDVHFYDDGTVSVFINIPYFGYCLYGKEGDWLVAFPPDCYTRILNPDKYKKAIEEYGEPLFKTLKRDGHVIKLE
jgi:hypothetical protein